jgi:hypothetical protein
MDTNNIVIIVVGIVSIIIAYSFIRFFNCGRGDMKQKKWAVYTGIVFLVISLVFITKLLISVADQSDHLNEEYAKYFDDLVLINKAVTEVDVFLQYDETIFCDTIQYLKQLEDNRISLINNSHALFDITDELFNNHFIKTDMRNRDLIFTGILSLILGLIIPEIRISLRLLWKMATY